MRLAAGSTDTIIVNNRAPSPLTVRALDAAGREVPGAPIRFTWVGGDSMPIDSSGSVTCAQSGDFVVRATLERMETRVAVRCRPVEYLRIRGPVQFVLGDSAMSRPIDLPVEAYGPDGRRVTEFAGSAQVNDSSVATLRGLTVIPRTRGITLAGVTVGDRAAAIGVHIYQRVSTLAALDTLLSVPFEQRLFAVPLRLERGEFQRQPLPPGGWMLAMLPEQGDDPNGIRLRIEGASCQPHLLNAPRRFGCNTGPGASVIVYRPLGSEPGPVVAAGDLLVRRLYPYPGQPVSQNVSDRDCRVSPIPGGSGAARTGCEFSGTR